MKDTEKQPDTCAECQYYLEYDDLDPEEMEEDDYTGVCRRYPPVVFPGITATSVYPDVSGPKGWCGEFMPIYVQVVTKDK
jgi:hypothetical protein